MVFKYNLIVIVFLKLYFISLLTFLAIDAVWLVFIAPKFYKTHIGYLMREKPNLLAALLFYILFMVGLVIFVIEPALTHNSLITVLLTGGLFGLVTYATYDLTNLATIKGWPIVVTLVDLVWGTVLSAIVSMVVFLAVSNLSL